MPRLPGSFQRGSPVPGQYTNQPAEAFKDGPATLALVPGQYREHLSRDSLTVYDGNSDEELYAEILSRKASLQSEQARKAKLNRRFRDLYHPRTFTEGGADHWPEGRPKAGGRVHVSINVYRAVVDIPAALQATLPVFNVPPTDSTPPERNKAARTETLFFEWVDRNDLEQAFQRACRVKGICAETAFKVWWDPIQKMPVFSVIKNPEDLYLGWSDSRYSRLDWALYCYGISPLAAEIDYGIKVDPKARTRMSVVGGDHADPLDQRYISGAVRDPNAPNTRSQSGYEMEQVEVYDYWWLEPGKKGKPQIWNTIYVGDVQVKPPKWHREYDRLPYVYLPNGEVDDQPEGVSDIYDVEQIVREKDERFSQFIQILHGIVGDGNSGGQMWQLVGSEVSDEMPPNAMPRPGRVATPGPNARIEAIQPFIPAYQFEQLFNRLDSEFVRVTGLNPLLMGEIPADALGSSRAISALIANFESRIHPRRKLLYRAMRELWDVSASVWEAKDSDVRRIIDGNHRLEIKPPELTPRDEAEVAQKAIQLMQNRIWSAERAMDATGVEDPADEKVLIREEQTDAAMNPTAVGQMAQLIALLKSLGQPTPPEAQAQADAQQRSLNAQRTLNPPVRGNESLNSEELVGNAPPESYPENAEQNVRAQSLIQDGEVQSRILTNTEI